MYICKRMHQLALWCIVAFSPRLISNEPHLGWMKSPHSMQHRLWPSLKTYLTVPANHSSWKTTILLITLRSNIEHSLLSRMAMEIEFFPQSACHCPGHTRTMFSDGPGSLKVTFFWYLLLPISKPLALVLDQIFGEEIGQILDQKQFLGNAKGKQGLQGCPCAVGRRYLITLYNHVNVCT